MSRVATFAALVGVCASFLIATSVAQASSAAPQSSQAVKCPKAVSQLVYRLTSVETVIESSTSYAKYAALLVSAKTAYNRIPIPQLKPACVLNVGVPAEKSMNKYIAAQNVWRQCVLAVDNCSKKVYDAPMQRLWLDAGKYLQKAINNLAD
jgi:hypothetical protein